MKVGIHFGIDTSNYTTSAAAISSAGEVFCAKRPLAVLPGDRGLRQSDALFCHTRDLHEVVKQCLEKVKLAHEEYEILSVGVSTQPRRVEGSYMPCFLAGVNAAESAAALLGVPCFSFSHQEGHLEAARLGSAQEGKELKKEEFLAFHLSGGTTELLSVRQSEGRYDAALLCATLDVTCGQLIDRCGTAMGLSFPSGPELEALAERSNRRFKIKIPAKEKGINLSGFENQFQKKKNEGASREDLARFVFDVVIAAIDALLSLAGDVEKPVLFSGGVSSSRILREHFNGSRYYFAPAAYSADNAIGIASLAGKGVLLGSTASADRHGSE